MRIFCFLILYIMVVSCKHNYKVVNIDNIDDEWVGDTLFLPMGDAIIPRPSNWVIQDEDNVFYKVCSDSCNDMLTIDVYDLKRYELSYEELISSYKEILRNSYNVDTIYPFRFEGESFNALGIKYNLSIDGEQSLRESIFLNYGKYALSFSFGVTKDNKKDRENRFTYLQGTIFLSSVFPDSIISTHSRSNNNSRCASGE